MTRGAIYIDFELARLMPMFELQPDGDDDERCPPNFTDDSDTITDDDDYE